MSPNDLHRGCGSQTKAQISKNYSLYHTNTLKMSPRKQGSLENNYKIQQATHCRVCLKKHNRTEMCPCAVRSEEFSHTKEANYTQIISSGSWGSDCPEFYSTGCNTDRNHNQGYVPRPNVTNKSQGTTGKQRPFPVVQPPHSCNQAVESFFHKERPYA